MRATLATPRLHLNAQMSAPITQMPKAALGMVSRGGALRCARTVMESVRTVVAADAGTALLTLQLGTTLSISGSVGKQPSARTHIVCRSAADARPSTRLRALAAINISAPFQANSVAIAHHVVIITGLPFLLSRSTPPSDRVPLERAPPPKCPAAPSWPARPSRR